jgi:hypothetical protein
MLWFACMLHVLYLLVEDGSDCLPSLIYTLALIIAPYANIAISVSSIAFHILFSWTWAVYRLLYAVKGAAIRKWKHVSRTTQGCVD